MKYKDIQEAIQGISFQIGQRACEYVSSDFDIFVEYCYYDSKDNSVICNIVGSALSGDEGAYSFDGDYFHIDVRIRESYDGDDKSIDCLVVLFLSDMAEADLGSPKYKGV